MITVCSDSPTTTRAIAAALAGLSKAGDLVVLAGEMGSGKTVFAQGFGVGLGVQDPITSPTFVLVHQYDGGRLTLHHADVYRLERLAEVADLALEELLEASGVVLVEWGDVVSLALGSDFLTVRLARSEPEADAQVDVDTGIAATSDDDLSERRVITLEAVGRGWTTRWSRLASLMEAWKC
jgi:tRNA threonylcarbamoyladenosine biosynthesis protein TsaE